MCDRPNGRNGPVVDRQVAADAGGGDSTVHGQRPLPTWVERVAGEGECAGGPGRTGLEIAGHGCRAGARIRAGLRDVPCVQEVDRLYAGLREVIVEVDRVAPRGCIWDKQTVGDRLPLCVLRVGTVQVSVLPVAVQVDELGTAVGALIEVHAGPRCAVRRRLPKNSSQQRQQDGGAYDGQNETGPVAMSRSKILYLLRHDTYAPPAVRTAPPCGSCQEMRPGLVRPPAFESFSILTPKSVRHNAQIWDFGRESNEQALHGAWAQAHGPLLDAWPLPDVRGNLAARGAVLGAGAPFNAGAPLDEQARAPEEDPADLQVTW